MRQVECWACGEPVAAHDREALRVALAAHIRAAHGQEPDPGEVQLWIERKATDPSDIAQLVLTAGRVLGGAAAVAFLLLAIVTPEDPRTAELLLYGGFAALAAALVCGLTLLGRLLQR